MSTANFASTRTVEVRQARFQVGAQGLAADLAGPESGPLVVLLHGGGQTRHSWRATTRDLAARGMSVVALDLRGHGESDWAADGCYEQDCFVGDVVGVLEQLSRPAALVGASLGGLTSLLVAGEAAPDRCRALVLVDVAPRIEPAGERRIIEFMTGNPEGFASLEEAAAAIAEYRRRPQPKDLDGLRKNLRLGEDGRWRWHWDPRLFGGERPLETVDQARYAAAAGKVRVPTLLIRGELSDVLSEAGGRHFLELIPEARVEEVADAHHMVVGDSNNRFRELVASFLAGSEAAARPVSTPPGGEAAAVQVERDGPLLVITLNRPHVHNAIDWPLARALAEAIIRLDADDEVRVGVLTGAGGTFCAGMDLQAFADGETPVSDFRGFDGLVATPPAKPLIAAVEGYAVAGGMEFVLACDIVVAARDARFGIPEVKRGLVAAGGGTIRLPRRIPYLAAMEMALTGSLVAAERAQALGLVNRLTDPGEALAEAKQLALEIAANAPLAILATKQLIASAGKWTEPESWERQTPVLGPVMSSEDATEGARAFKEKREPKWQGR